MVAALVLFGCKDKSGEPQQEVPAAGEGTEAATDPPAPLVAVSIDAASIAKLSEKPSTIFQAQDNTTQPLHWSVQGEEIAFRAEATTLPERKDAGPRYDLKIFASMKEAEDALVYECSDLRALASGKANLVLRGDMLHVLCINPALADDPGMTDAARFELNLGKRALVGSGSYGGDGSLDLDTIDLDEGE